MCRRPEINRREEMMFLDALVDDRAHPRTARLGGDGQGLQSARCKRLNEFLRHGVRAEGRNRHREPLPENGATEGIDLWVVRDRRTHESDLFAVGKGVAHLALDDGERTVARAAKAVARHAEAAVTSAPARCLDEVKAELRIVRNDNRMGGVSVEILHPLPRHTGRCPRLRQECRQMPLRIVCGRIECRDIDPGDMRKPLQERRAVVARMQPRMIGVHHRRKDRLPLTDDKGIDQCGERFGVERGTWPPRDNEGVMCRAIRGKRRDMTAREHFRDMKIIHLKRNGKADDGEVRERRLRLHAHHRRIRAHIARHLIAIGQKDALTRRITALIQQRIDNVQPEVRHADKVSIGIDESKSRARARRIAIIPALLRQTCPQTFPQPMIQSPLCLSFFLTMCTQRLQFLDEIRNIIELPIDRGEANVSDLVKVLQMLHDDLTDLLGGHFGLRAVADLMLDLCHKICDLLHRDVALITGAYDARQQLVAAERLTAAIAFDDHERQTFHHLIRRKSPAALSALTAATDGHSLLCRTRINDTAVRFFAKRASHCPHPLSRITLLTAALRTLRCTLFRLLAVRIAAGGSCILQ